MASQKNKERTYARNRAVSRTGREKIYERDSTYFLKLVVVLLLGAFWIRFATPIEIGALALGAFPLGLVIGIFLVSRLEKFQYDRKIWYAILLVMTIISYFMPVGLVL